MASFIRFYRPHFGVIVLEKERVIKTHCVLLQSRVLVLKSNFCFEASFWASYLDPIRSHQRTCHDCSYTCNHRIFCVYF